MKRIRISPPADCYTTLSDVSVETPIFAVKDGKIKGMLINERSRLTGKPGWIIKIGGYDGSCGSCGHSYTREDALKESSAYYDYFVIDPEIKQ